MAGGGRDVITIDRLTAECERQYALHLGWFAELASWVVDEPDPVRQRCFAEAAHRHAWLAELWAGRRPRIPPEAVPELPPAASVAGDADRVVGYAAALDAMRADLAELRDAADPELDPSTHRVITLVDADLADLRSRLT